MSLNDPGCCSWLSGSFQALVEFSTAPVTDGFGDIVLGPTALLRYNWVRPGCRLVPYLQAGAGFVYNDAYENHYQHAIGEAMEFALKAAAGFHYFINDNLSLDVEGGYIHISNADLASRNLGINAVGGSIGMTIYLPCGR
jgi:opacity protein-like surface antigen